MLDGVKQKITRLIADFESERAERKRLQIELEKMATRNEAYKKQILELEREIDNLKLKGAFLSQGGDSAGARKKIDVLIGKIDKCIALVTDEME